MWTAAAKRTKGSKHTISTRPRAFVAYFPGAVVPLATPGIVVERRALSPLDAPADRYSVIALLGLFGSIAGLSLTCFFMLRRLMRESREEDRVLACQDILTGLQNRRMYDAFLRN